MKPVDSDSGLCPKFDVMYYYFAQRPTLQYDGLHDRALKHYFSLHRVREKLTLMQPVSQRKCTTIHIKQIKYSVVTEILLQSLNLVSKRQNII